MSDKPVLERLQVKGDRRLAVLDAVPALDDAIGGADRRAPPTDAEVLLIAVADRAALDLALPRLHAAPTGAILWLAYPKLSSPLAGDLGRDAIRAVALANGLDTVAQIAVDTDWSALRLKRS